MTAPFAQQVAWGISLLKFATVEDEGHWRGLTYLVAVRRRAREDKTARFYLERPMRGAFLMLGHAYAGFHYDQIMPYWRLDRARPLTIWLVLSSAIVFLGVVRIADMVVARRSDADSAFAIATFALCVASLVWSRRIAVRYRRIRDAVPPVAGWPGAGRRARSGRARPGLVMYLALSFLYNTLLLQSADIRLWSLSSRCRCRPRVLAADTEASPRIPLHWLWNEQRARFAYTVSAERRE